MENAQLKFYFRNEVRCQRIYKAKNKYRKDLNNTHTFTHKHMNSANLDKCTNKIKNSGT